MTRKQRRSGYSFIELVISMGSSVILMAGLCSVLFISSRAITPGAMASDEGSRSALAASQLVADLRLALSFSERTTRAVTFTVPDRDGNGQVETLRYSWTGAAGDPLLYQDNGNAAVTLASNVQQFNLAALTRVISADTLAAASTMVAFQSFAENKATSNVGALTVSQPSGVVAGDLLIAAVAVDGVAGTDLIASGWTLISRLNSGATVGLGVWWKIATASEPASYAFSWTGSEQAYGWIMRFSGADASAPINAFVTNVGTSSTPTCLATTTSVSNAVVVRIGAFDDSAVTVDDSGIASHKTITVDRSNTSGTASASGGAAYVALPAVGTTGAVNFALSSSQEFVTFTLAIAPAP